MVDALRQWEPRRPTLLLIDEPSSAATGCLQMLEARRHVFWHPVRVLLLDQAFPLALEPYVEGSAPAPPTLTLTHGGALDLGELRFDAAAVRSMWNALCRQGGERPADAFTMRKLWASEDVALATVIAQGNPLQVALLLDRLWRTSLSLEQWVAKACQVDGTPSAATLLVLEYQEVRHRLVADRARDLVDTYLGTMHRLDPGLPAVLMPVVAAATITAGLRLDDDTAGRVDSRALDDLFPAANGQVTRFGFRPCGRRSSRAPSWQTGSGASRLRGPERAKWPSLLGAWSPRAPCAGCTTVACYLMSCRQPCEKSKELGPTGDFPCLWHRATASRCCATVRRPVTWSRAWARSTAATGSNFSGGCAAEWKTATGRTPKPLGAVLLTLHYIAWALPLPAIRNKEDTLAWGLAQLGRWVLAMATVRVPAARERDLADALDTALLTALQHWGAEWPRQLDTWRSQMVGVGARPALRACRRLVREARRAETADPGLDEPITAATVAMRWRLAAAFATLRPGARGLESTSMLARQTERLATAQPKFLAHANLQEERARAWRHAAYAASHLGGERALEVSRSLAERVEAITTAQPEFAAHAGLQEERARAWRHTTYAASQMGGERALEVSRSLAERVEAIATAQPEFRRISGCKKRAQQRGATRPMRPSDLAASEHWRYLGRWPSAWKRSPRRSPISRRMSGCNGSAQ